MSPWAIEHFQLDRFTLPGATSVLLQINCGIYGLPQSGLLAQKKLKTHLADHGYMRYHWLRQRCKEFRDFDIVWDAGRSVTQSIADFLTKPHNAKHTAAMRRYFVQDCGPAVFASPRSRATRA